MIGLLVVQAVHRAGATRVVAVDVDEARLSLARQLGATETVLAGAGAVARILELTGGRGADLAIECVGAEAPIHTAVSSVRKGGSVVLVGNVSPKIALPLQEVVSRQIRLQGSCASSGEYPLVIDLIATGEIRVDPLISAVAPLSEGPLWFDRLYRREPNLMKVILQP
jgi:L-iditol 2-dehydrogenase